MTRTTNSRVAGVAFLFYIVVGIASMMLASGATRGDTVAARLASGARQLALGRRRPKVSA